MRAAIVTVALLLSGSAGAVELHYRFHPGELLRWRLEELRHRRSERGSSSAGALETVRATLTARVLAVRADGAAEVELSLAADAQPRCRAFRAGVDRRGRWTLERLPRAGACAELAISAQRIFALAALPDGDQAIGRVVELESPAAKLRWSLAALDGDLAVIRVEAGDPPSGRAGPGAPPAGALAADLIARFDTAAGRLVELRGTLIDRGAGKVSARISLARVE